MDARARPGRAEQDTLAPHGPGQPGQQVRPHLRPRVVDVDDPAARPVGVGPRRGQPGPVNPVAGHELRGLRGKRLRLRRSHSLCLGLRQQLAYPVEQGAGRVRMHTQPPGRSSRTQYRTVPAPYDIPVEPPRIAITHTGAPGRIQALYTRVYYGRSDLAERLVR